MANEEERRDISLDEVKLIILNSLPIPATYSEKAKHLTDLYGEKYNKALGELLRDGYVKISEDLKIELTEKGKVYLERISNQNIQKFITEDGIKGLFPEISTSSQEEFIEKISTWLNAMEEKIEKKYKDVYDIYITLPIEELIIFKVGDDETYEFKIFGKVFKIDGSKILSPSTFISTFFKTFGVVLPNMPKVVWHYILTKWKTTIAKFKKEKITQEDIIVDTILNYINSCLVSSKINLSFNEGIVYVEEDKVFVPNTIIKRILEKERIKISLRRLAELLKDYRYPNERRWIENKKVYFWVFKLDKLNLDLSKVVEEEKEVQTNLGEKDENSG
ncbi:MAG TPA: hypothetical protein ENF99_00935 [Candidatus Aenigmarchaeota archaeon]|nr:hypothetical protein [Candidatus Aenigmarchaeota archaeon]